MLISVIFVKGGERFREEGIVVRLELVDKLCKIWCC